MQRKPILVVDDSKTMHKMYELMLRRYPLVHASDRREALDCLRAEENIDLVLLDLYLLVLNRDLLAEMRAERAGAALTVVVVGTEGHEEDIARAIDSGADAAINKPFQGEEILALIARLDAKGQG